MLKNPKKWALLLFEIKHMRKPDSKKIDGSTYMRRVRHVSDAFKRAFKTDALTLWLCLPLTVFMVFLSVYSMFAVSASMSAQKKTVEEHLKSLASLAAAVVSVEELDQIKDAEDIKKSVYSDAKKRLAAFCEQWNLLYVYYMRSTSDGRFQYIVDNSYDPAQTDGPDSFINIADEPAAMKALEEGKATSQKIGSEYSKGWEGIASGYSPVYDTNGEIYCIAGVDIEDKQLLQAEKKIQLLQIVNLCALFLTIVIGGGIILIYRRKVKLSIRASRAKSEFLSNMSHEMRTPMNAILGMTAIAKASYDPEKKDYCLDNVNTAATHMLNVINDILDISKIEANKFKVSPVSFDFERMLQKVISIIHLHAEEKQQEFLISIDDKIPRVLVADNQRLTQVLTNLLSNAVKFTPDGGAITLNASLLNETEGMNTLLIKVIDTGIGITKEQQSRLFDFFEQADNSISRQFGGTGLGLAISKRIVEMMGGKIWIESTPGQGSIFSFTIQAKTGEEKPEAADSAMKWQSIRVLAVCGAAETQSCFINAAVQRGFLCDIVADNEQASAIIEKNDIYDFVFIDGKIPNIAELIETVRNAGQSGTDAKRSQIAAVVSTFEWGALLEKFGSPAIDHFLSKPILPCCIIDCINTCFGFQPVPEKQEPSTESLAGHRILLAEDMEINQEIVRALLEPLHLEIVCAKNGLETLTLFSESPEKYDIILMDVQMPEMDGYTATRRIRGLDVPNARTIPIIAMTANVFREDVEECLAAGMNDHIAKPIVFEEVIKKLREYLPAAK